jgi:CheY-like chemotaxis protein
MTDDAAPTRVLVVEDEYVIALDLSQQLEDAGLVVCGPASNTPKALSLIDESPPDVALLDVNLGGGKTSYDIARKLILLDIPFAFLSGYSIDQLMPEFENVPLLAKPCSAPIIVKVIGTLVAGRSQTRCGQATNGQGTEKFFAFK